MTRGPARNPDLHGNVPENSAVALLLIDVINDLAFDGSEPIVRQAPAMAERLAALKRRAKSARVLKADIAPSDALDLEALIAGAPAD